MMGFPLGNLRSRPFVIEPLARTDSAHLAKLHRLTFSQPWSDEEFHALMVEANVFGFIAREEGNLSAPPGGFVLARLVLDEAEILTVAVAPASQRRGIGHALMDATLRHLHNARADMLFLEVDEVNLPALALYRRLGFKQVGKRPGYYETADGRSAALTMRRDLKQAR
ncbi:ribosomal protein S18-alanine N-acetyltransferase [Phyllobacterium myrsinacearum]|uniref:Ribosomal-protein-alanine N-acetyltransferase n=1 Tax=Phyllobacterium myrsinacearum TaxID=28101 RepID=A0A839EBQ9_9HYPH|nr:ribosomal protein S18-alanine N-acetyltransferase [Phyllobacterium myrsinacearum]MBA8877341.1 ribosomal-protein-alanine N-acetyltransferase [Phyllobacterium myrsinacearum]